MFKNPKGQFGYLAAARKRSILTTILFFAIALILYIIGIVQYGSNRNFFTLAAILLCLPGGKAAVRMIMCLRAKGATDEEHAAICAAIGDLPGSYDLYLTSYTQNFAISHMAYRNKTLVAYSGDPGCQEADFQKHMTQMLKNDDISGITISLFTDLAKYTERLKELQKMEERDPAFGEKVLHVAESVSL